MGKGKSDMTEAKHNGIIPKPRSATQGCTLQDDMYEENYLKLSLGYEWSETFVNKKDNC
jgi:hypothetical protein